MLVDMTAARDLSLQDWGTTIIHQAVEQSYDPQTQATVETATETELAAIVGPVESQPATETGGQHRVERRTFLVATADWPAVFNVAVRRLKVGDAVYEVVETSLSEAAGLLQVIGRKVN